MTFVAAPRRAVISVHYYPEYLKSSVARALDLCARVGATRCVVVANQPALSTALTSAFVGRGLDADVVVHDNSGLEFGAYQAGLDRLFRASEPDWTIVINDTYARHECYSSPMRRKFMSAVTTTDDVETPIAVGPIDSLPRSYTLLGARSHRWIRSNAFALNRGALRALDWRLRCVEVDALVRGGTDEGTFLADDLDEILAHHLRSFLFHPDACPSWYRAAALDAGNAAAFARKACSILQEKYLSARLDAVSAIFIDTKPVFDSERLAHRLDATAFQIGQRYRSYGGRSAASTSAK